MSEQHTPEPFIYVHAQPFGWEECEADDDGAVALFNPATVEALQAQRNQLLAALKGCLTEMSALRCSLATFTGASAGWPGEEESAALSAIAAAEGGK